MAAVHGRRTAALHIADTAIRDRQLARVGNISINHHLVGAHSETLCRHCRGMGVDTERLDIAICGAKTVDRISTIAVVDIMLHSFKRRGERPLAARRHRSPQTLIIHCRGCRPTGHVADTTFRHIGVAVVDNNSRQLHAHTVNRNLIVVGLHFRHRHRLGTADKAQHRQQKETLFHNSQNVLIIS